MTGWLGGLSGLTIWNIADSLLGIQQKPGLIAQIHAGYPFGLVGPGFIHIAIAIWIAALLMAAAPVAGRQGAVAVAGPQAVAHSVPIVRVVGQPVAQPIAQPVAVPMMPMQSSMMTPMAALPVASVPAAGAVPLSVPLQQPPTAKNTGTFIAL